MTDKALEYLFVLIIGVALMVLFSYESLLEVVERKDYTNLTQHCYRIGFMDALICKIK